MSDVAQTVRAFPVSVKGVLVRDGQVLLLKNEREEWELPGGKLGLGEEPLARMTTEPKSGDHRAGAAPPGEGASTGSRAGTKRARVRRAGMAR